MESKKTNIAQWLLSIPKVPNPNGPFFEEGMYGYLDRINAIDKKIGSLIDAVNFPIIEVNYFEKRLAYNTYIQRMRKIREAIGVYLIHGVIGTGTFLKFERPLWSKYSNDNSNSKYVRNASYTSGYEWFDYFGDREINERDTYLIVSLSDKGISYLNEIANKVSSYDTVTV
jgi:hypothetical protein